VEDATDLERNRRRPGSGDGDLYAVAVSIDSR